MEWKEEICSNREKKTAWGRDYGLLGNSSCEPCQLKLMSFFCDLQDSSCGRSLACKFYAVACEICAESELLQINGFDTYQFG